MADPTQLTPLTALLLLRFHARLSARPPTSVVARNRRPLYCGRPVTLKAAPEGAVFIDVQADHTPSLSRSV